MVPSTCYVVWNIVAEYLGAEPREITGLKSKTPRSGDGDVWTALLSLYFYGDLFGQLHRLHSKVRTSGPSDVETTPLSIIGPWHFGHGDRSISMRLGSMRDCGMCCAPMIRREHDTLSRR